MPNADLLLAFVLAASVFAYMPGPAMLYATAQTLAGGRRAGWLAALGIHIGGYIHVVAAALGLAILFQVIPALYVALKIAGAVYLVWLGLKLILDRTEFTGDLPTAKIKTQNRAFWESVTVEVLNPKTAIFYLAFLPQFTDAGASFPIWLQLFVLGTIVNIMFSSADVICVLLADRLSLYFRRSASSARVIKRLGGGILVALGLRIAFSSR